VSVATCNIVDDVNALGRATCQALSRRCKWKVRVPLPLSPLLRRPHGRPAEPPPLSRRCMALPPRPPSPVSPHPSQPPALPSGLSRPARALPGGSRLCAPGALWGLGLYCSGIKEGLDSPERPSPSRPPSTLSGKRAHVYTHAPRHRMTHCGTHDAQRTCALACIGAGGRKCRPPHPPHPTTAFTGLF
jgi:hypothetical protein